MNYCSLSFLRDTYVFTAQVNADGDSEAVFMLQYEELIIRELSRYRQTLYLNPGAVVEDLQVLVRAVDSQGIVQPTASHFASINLVSDEEVTFTYSPPPRQQRDTSKGLNREMFVEYDVNHPPDGAGLFLVNDGYFIQFFSPSDIENVPLDVVFVIDVSGSMEGTKINQTIEALVTIINELSPEDRLTLVTFASRVTFWMTQLASVEMHRQEAIEFVEGLVADGATNFYAGLTSGANILSLLGDPNHAQVLVTLTDGHPNSGLQDPDAIVENTNNFLEGTRISLNSLGFGTDLNFDLLERLSLSNNGIARQIYESEEAASQLEGFFESIVSPVLSDISITYEDGTVETITDTEFQLLFNGSEIIVGGTFSTNGTEAVSIQVQVTGNGVGGAQVFETIVDPNNITVIAGLEPEVEKTVAQLTIRQLLDDRVIAETPEDAAAIEQEIIDLAVQYNLLLPELTTLVISSADEMENFTLRNDTPVIGADSTSGVVHILTGFYNTVQKTMIIMTACMFPPCRYTETTAMSTRDLQPPPRAADPGQLSSL